MERLIHTKKWKLPIGGFLKQSFVDYPGHISCVVFTKGCNFSCGYCHNKKLVIPKFLKEEPALPNKEIHKWITCNRSLLDAVVISGGEPTLHEDLINFAWFVKNMKLKTKLFTNGTNAHMIEYLTNNNLIDSVSLDIKAPLSVRKYKKVVGEIFTERILTEIQQTLDILKKSKIHFEIRTTLDHSLSLCDIQEIACLTEVKYYLQVVKGEDLLTDEANLLNYNLIEIEKNANQSERITLVN